MKKYMIILGLIIFLTNIVQSQFSVPIKNDANQVSNRILAVELLEANPRVVKKLQKKFPERKEEYLKNIKEYNEFIKTQLPKYWRLNKNIEFKRTSEITKIFATKDNRYCVFMSGSRKEAKSSAKVVYTFDSYTFFLYLPEYSKGWDNLEYVDEVNVYDASGMDKAHYVFKLSYPSSGFNGNDIKLTSDIFYEQIERAKSVGKDKNRWRNVFFVPKMETNVVVLKTDTLLIPQYLKIEPKAINDIYGYPYKLVNNEEHEKIIENQTKGYVYITMLWDDFARDFNYFLVSSSDNRILDRIGRGNVEMKVLLPIVANFSFSLDLFRYELGFNENHLEVLNKMVSGEIIQKNKDVVYQ